MFNLWHKIIGIISFEFILTSCKKSNGGSIIALRSFLSALSIFLIILTVINIIDPNRSFSFSCREFRLQIIDKISWLGVFFASIYVALYARFSSQWTYLANLYNQIKQTEAKDPVNEIKIAELKAGFIEDAEVLHLFSKPIFASIICTWGKEAIVKKKYIKFTPGGEQRYKRVINITEKICETESKKYI